MGLLTKKYTAWAKHPQNYTAEQVLNQIVADLKWLDEEQAKNCSIPDVVGRSEQFYCDGQENNKDRCETQCLGCAEMQEIYGQ